MTCNEVEAARRTGRNGTHASAFVQRHKCPNSPFTLDAVRPRAARTERRRKRGEVERKGHVWYLFQVAVRYKAALCVKEIVAVF